MSFQIKFHHIRAFVEVAREGSIRGASRALAISQPALTKAIKELEEGSPRSCLCAVARGR
jgi:LysR family transcriptional regulator of abg operon